VIDRELEVLLDSLPVIHFVGVDAATHSGGALFRVDRAGFTPSQVKPPGLFAARGGVVREVTLAAVRTSTLGGEWTFACDLLADVEASRAAGGPPPLLVVAWEDQYLGKNPQSMMTVVAARARLLHALELRARQKGVRLHAVDVNTMSWQSKVLGRHRRKLRATIKATSDCIAPKIAAACGSAVRPQGDAADATCIGLHEIARHYTIDLAAIRGESGEPEERRRRR